MDDGEERVGAGTGHWQVIGIHRPLASFWFNFVIMLVAAIPGVIMMAYVMPNFILPYPSALGFKTLTITYFGLFFSIMDLATQPACERFVAQYAEISPRKALRYVQFFIYFQMFTGLVQVTGVAIFCLTYIVHTDLAYASWFFLLYSTTQFPGMLAAYNSTLRGFQRFDRSSVVELVQGAVFEVATQIIFILAGRWWGAANPAVGELMGATLGYIVGRYIDDFFAMGLSAYFLSKILRPFGISMKETLIPAFGAEEVRTSLAYGLKLLGSTLVSVATDYFTLIMMISWVPNYISILAYIEIAKMVADLVNTRYNFSALVSEAYNNGKKQLTEYAVTSYFKHWWYLAFFMALEIAILIPPVFEYLGGEWGKAAWLIPIYVFPRMGVTPPVIGAELLQACDRPEYRTFGIIVEKVVKMIAVFVLLSPYAVRALYPHWNIIILYVLHDLPAYLAITIAEFGLLHKHCVPVRINLWQTFVAGTVASLPMIPLNFLVLEVLHAVAAGGSTAAVIGVVVVVLILGLFFGPTILFFFYGLVGGWDDYGLHQFELAVGLSGPSRFVVSLFYRATRLGHRISPLANRFPIPHVGAEREIAELMAQTAYHDLPKNE
jgi:hypothetical protein